MARWRDARPPPILGLMTRYARNVAWTVAAVLILALVASLILESL